MDKRCEVGAMREEMGARLGRYVRDESARRELSRLLVGGEYPRLLVLAGQLVAYGEAGGGLIARVCSAVLADVNGTWEMWLIIDREVEREERFPDTLVLQRGGGDGE